MDDVLIFVYFLFKLEKQFFIPRNKLMLKWLNDNFQWLKFVFIFQTKAQNEHIFFIEYFPN